MQLFKVCKVQLARYMTICKVLVIYASAKCFHTVKLDLVWEKKSWCCLTVYAYSDLLTYFCSQSDGGYEQVMTLQAFHDVGYKKNTQLWRPVLNYLSSLDCFNFGKNQFSPIVCQQPLGSKYFQNSSSLWFCSGWKQWAYYWNQLAEFSFNLNHLAFPDTTVSILSGLHAQGNEVSLTHYTVI